MQNNITNNNRLSKSFNDEDERFIVGENDESLHMTDEDKKSKKIIQEASKQCLVSCVIIVFIILFCFLGIYLPEKFAEDSKTNLTSIDRYNQVGWIGTMIGVCLPVLALVYHCSGKCWRFCYVNSTSSVFGLFQKKPTIIEVVDTTEPSKGDAKINI